MPLSSSAAPPGSGAARTWPLSSIRCWCGLAVKVFGGGTEVRGAEESGLQAAMMYAAAAVPSTVDRRQVAVLERVDLVAEVAVHPHERRRRRRAATEPAAAEAAASRIGIAAHRGEGRVKGFGLR